MSLFPDIKIDGHAFKEGLDANGGPLQKVIQKNQFTEALRGQPFRRKLASILARIRTPVRMPPRRADTNQPPYCGRATGGPNRRPGPNQPGTPAPGGRGTDAPRPPPVRTRFNGTTAPDVGFRARRGSGGRCEGGRRNPRGGREGRC